jgi:hypothetical protein
MAINWTVPPLVAGDWPETRGRSVRGRGRRLEQGPPHVHVRAANSLGADELATFFEIAWEMYLQHFAVILLGLLRAPRPRAGHASRAVGSPRKSGQHRRWHPRGQLGAVDAPEARPGRGGPAHDRRFLAVTERVFLRGDRDSGVPRRPRRDPQVVRNVVCIRGAVGGKVIGEPTASSRSERSASGTERPSGGRAQIHAGTAEARRIISRGIGPSR